MHCWKYKWNRGHVTGLGVLFLDITILGFFQGTGTRSPVCNTKATLSTSDRLINICIKSWSVVWARMSRRAILTPLHVTPLAPGEPTPHVEDSNWNPGLKKKVTNSQIFCFSLRIKFLTQANWGFSCYFCFLWARVKLKFGTGDLFKQSMRIRCLCWDVCWLVGVGVVGRGWRGCGVGRRGGREGLGLECEISRMFKHTSLDRTFVVCRL